MMRQKREELYKRMMGERQNKRKMTRQKRELAAELKTKRKKKKDQVNKRISDKEENLNKKKFRRY